MGRAGVLVALAGLLAATLVSPAGVAAEEGQGEQQVAEQAAGVVGAATSRLSGSDRYGSAVAISAHRYADPAAASVVYLANGQEFSDALTAGTLSDGPVLLVRPECGTVPQVVKDEIDRIDPDQVVALGGAAAVCEDALAAAAGGRATARVGGEDRYETAALIAQRQFPSGSATVYLAKGQVSADALGGGMLKDGPILLVSWSGSVVPPETLAAIESLGATQVVALGGPAAVSDAALAEAAGGRQTGRLAGANRWETALAIAEHAYPARTSRIYLARGDRANFADAVAAGMLVDGPVLVTPGSCERVRKATAAFLQERHPSRVVALGGPAALCQSSLRGAALDARPAIDCAAVACVALTFDDGPSWPTPTLLDTLAAHRIPATFFTIGEQVDAYPQHSRRAYLEGHDVENHTWDHPYLPNLSRSQQQWQVDVTDAELNRAGVPDATLMRPPYGAYNSSTRQLGFPLVLWDVDPRDWDGPATEQQVISRVLGAVTPGSIVLQHDIWSNSVNAVPEIVTELKNRGYTFVTVHELVPGLDPGDIVYRRGNVTTSGTPASPDDIIVLEDGTQLGPVLDEAPVPGLAPSIPLQELLGGTG